MNYLFGFLTMVAILFFVAGPEAMKWLGIPHEVMCGIYLLGLVAVGTWLLGLLYKEILSIKK